MKISIAMCTYNGCTYIDEMLQSILRQTRQPDEVIIHDDCSKDNTVQIIKTFIQKNNLEDKGWRLAVNEHNLGFKRNFFETVNETYGDIIFLADQDDIWLSTKLEEVEQIMMKQEVLAVNTTYSIVDSEGNIKTSGSNTAKIDAINVEKIILKNLAPGCTAAFKREVLEVYLKSFQSVMEHDWYLNIIAAGLEGLYSYDKDLIYYRIHEHNTIGLADNRNAFDRIKQMYSYWDKYVTDQYKRIEFLANTNLFQKIHQNNELRKFVEIRYNNLEKRKLRLWMKEVVLYLSDLQSIVDSRGIIIDFLRVFLKPYNGWKK